MGKGFYVVYIDLKHLGIEEDIRKVAYYDPSEARQKDAPDPYANVSPAMSISTKEVMEILEEHLFKEPNPK